MSSFISFEGIDGSGKSTISKIVYEKLIKSGYKAVLTCEPTDTKIGKYVQTCIKTGADPFVTAFSFIADRILHCEMIKKWLDENNIKYDAIDVTENMELARKHKIISTPTLLYQQQKYTKLEEIKKCLK